MKRLIIFLIRKRLGLKKRQWFRFTNQKDDCYYCFTNEHLLKIRITPKKELRCSSVSLNWLLDDKCKVVKKYE